MMLRIAAALDVTEPEPLPPDDELFRLDNALITPHVAGNFHLRETVERVIRIVGANLRKWQDGQPLPTVGRRI